MSLARHILCKLFCTLSMVVMLLQVAQPYIYGAVMAHGMDGHHSLLANAEEEAVRTGVNEVGFSLQPFVAELIKTLALAQIVPVSTEQPQHLDELLHVPLFLSLRNIRI